MHICLRRLHFTIPCKQDEFNDFRMNWHPARFYLEDSYSITPVSWP